MAAINGAIASTLGILVLTGAISADVAGAIGAALGAWILVGSFLLVRPKVDGPVTVAAKDAQIAELSKAA